MKNIVCIFLLFTSSIAFSASERVTFSGSRSSQQVGLEEDYFKDFTYTERVPVTRNVCQDIPVTQNYCEWIPGQRICQTRPICHPTPYGPRCLPTYGCYDTPARQVCRPVTTIQRRCGQSTTYEYVTRTERRYMYRSIANIEFSFADLPEDYSTIEFDVSLENDRISLNAYDFRGPVIISSMLENDDDRRGNHYQRYYISSMSRNDYLSPVSQIPALRFFDGTTLSLSTGETLDISHIDVELTLVSRRYGESLTFNPKNVELINDGASVLDIDLFRELGRRFYRWQNNIRVIEVKISRKVDGQIINDELKNSSFVTNRFYF